MYHILQIIYLQKYLKNIMKIVKFSPSKIYINEIKILYYDICVIHICN